MKSIIILYVIILLTIPQRGFSSDYAVSLIPDELLKNANSVIREHSLEIFIEKTDKMKSHKKLVRTIFKNDDSNQVDLVFFYDPFRKIKTISGFIYDAEGNKIKEIKKKDFSDRSATSSGQLYSDDRLLHYGYNSPTFPITIAYEIVYESKSTGFIEDWNPLNNFNTSVQKSKYQIKFNNDLGIKTKEHNFDFHRNITFEKGSEVYTYNANNLSAIKKEHSAPLWKKIAPRASIALENFSLQGVTGNNQDWSAIGKWMYHSLIKNEGTLKPSVVKEITLLTSKTSSKKEKAEVVYKYMQDRTRYIGVQLGIGGWKPISAQKVHDSGYGDCKGLTNYMMALLKSIGIKSHYSVIYGDHTIKHIDSDYSEIEGNHVILCIPDLVPGDTTWLECTSQVNPFGYLGSFTGNRNALILTPEGGYIKNTTHYDESDNKMERHKTVLIDPSGSASIEYDSKLSGVFYDHSRVLEFYEDDLNDYYRKYWDKVKNLKIQKANYQSNRTDATVTESVLATAGSFATLSNTDMLISAHKLDHALSVPPRSRNRRLPIVVERGSTQIDKTIMHFPKNYRIESLPESFNIDSSFGTYELSFSTADNNSIQIERRLIIKAGTHSAESYKDYRNFYKKCSKADQSKILITNKT